MHYFITFTTVGSILSTFRFPTSSLDDLAVLSTGPDVIILFMLNSDEHAI